MNNTTTTGTLNPTQYNSICTDVQTRCNSGEKVTMLGLSKQYSITPAEMRKILVDHFGSRITFTRGRNGGIRIL
jgi:hypothetical protein